MPGAVLAPVVVHDRTVVTGTVHQVGGETTGLAHVPSCHRPGKGGGPRPQLTQPVPPMLTFSSTELCSRRPADTPAVSIPPVPRVVTRARSRMAFSRPPASSTRVTAARPVSPAPRSIFCVPTPELLGDRRCQPVAFQF